MYGWGSVIEWWGILIIPDILRKRHQEEEYLVMSAENL